MSNDRSIQAHIEAFEKAEDIIGFSVLHHQLK